MAVTAPDIAEEAFALQTRAQALKMLSADDAERDGEEDRIEVGLGGFNDAVLGEDKLRVGGDLHEDIEGMRQSSAARVDTTVRGNATLRFKEYGTIMAGVMQEKHLNGSLLLAGMSDDLVGGGGVRLTSAVDLWAGSLIGMEEKIGTANSDGILAEAYAKMFEREYGAAVHVAGMAVFSGTVRVTTATGFWALNRVSTGVRQLNPGGGGGSGAAPAPAAPPPVAAGAAAMAVTALPSPASIRAGGLLTDMADLEDMRRLEELQSAAGLEDATDIARSLEELSQNLDDIGQRAEDVDTLRRLADPEADAPARMLSPAADPRAMTPDELAEWRRQNDADDWFDLLSGAAPQAGEAAKKPDDLFGGVVPATMAEADEMLSEVRRGLMPDGFDFDQVYRSLEDARSVDRTETNMGSYLVLTAAQDELLTNSDAMMAALIRHADPDEARRLGEIENLSARRAAMVAAIEDARQAGDIARVVELESILIGFDATAMRLMKQATASADAIRSLPTPKLPGGVNRGQLEDALQAEIDRLMRLQPKLEPEEQQQVMDQLGMYIKAKEMVANGDDPRPFLRDQAEYVKWQELQMQHKSGTQQYPGRGTIYPVLTLEVINKIEDLIQVQGIQLDELEALDDILEARRFRIQDDGRQAAGFDDVVSLEDTGQARRGEFVDAPAFMDDGLHYEDLDNLTRVDADVTVRQAEVPDPTPPPLPPGHPQQADPDLTASWEWTPRRPVDRPPEPLQADLDRATLVHGVRIDQRDNVMYEVQKGLKELSDSKKGKVTNPKFGDPEVRKQAVQNAMENERLYIRIVEAIQRGEDPLVLLDNELALARYADSLDDARYAEEFGGTRLPGRVEAIEDIKRQVLHRLAVAGRGDVPGEFNTGHRYKRIPHDDRIFGHKRTLKTEPPLVTVPEYASAEIVVVPARVTTPSLDESLLLPGELVAIQRGYEDLDSITRKHGYDHLDPIDTRPRGPGGDDAPDPVNTGPSRPEPGYADPDALNAGPSRPEPGYADPDALNAGPSRQGPGYEDPDAINAGPSRPEHVYHVLEGPAGSDLDASLVHSLDPELSGGYDVIRGTEALEAEYDVIGRSADETSIYKMPPDTIFATHDTVTRTWSDWALADAREVVAWAQNRSVFARAWGRFKEMLYDVRDLPMVLVNSLLLNEGKIDDLMDLARRGRATRDSHAGSSGMGAMTLMEAEDIIRRADGTFDQFTNAGASPFAKSWDAAEAYAQRHGITPGSERWRQIFGGSTHRGGSLGDADFDDVASPGLPVPSGQQGAPAVEPLDIPRTYRRRSPVPEKFEDFKFDWTMGNRWDTHLSDSAAAANQVDPRITDNFVGPAFREIKDYGRELLKSLEPGIDPSVLDEMSAVQLRNRMLALLKQAEEAGEVEEAAKIREAIEDFERMAHRTMFDAVQQAEQFNVWRTREAPAHVDKDAITAVFDRRFEFYKKKWEAAEAAGDADAMERYAATMSGLNLAKSNIQDGADPLASLRFGVEHKFREPHLLDIHKVGWNESLREVEAIWNAGLKGKKLPTDKQFAKIHRKHEQARVIQENLEALNLL